MSLIHLVHYNDNNAVVLLKIILNVAGSSVQSWPQELRAVGWYV